MAGRDIPIHTVSFGSRVTPPDLAVMDVEISPMILKTDRAHGTITLKDELSAGTPFRVVVEDEQGNPVWDKELSAIEANRRRIAFDFPIEEMVEERISELGLDNSVEINSVPMRMKARVEPVAGEVGVERKAGVVAIVAVAIAAFVAAVVSPETSSFVCAAHGA